MRSWLLSAGLVVAVAAPAHGQADSARRPVLDDLRWVADSLDRLDPARELTAALRRGDRRFVGVEGYVRVAPGLDFTDPLYPVPEEMRVIRGTGDMVLGAEGARLNRVAAAYAERYNRLLRAHLRRERRPPSRPAP